LERDSFKVRTKSPWTFPFAPGGQAPADSSIFSWGRPLQVQFEQVFQDLFIGEAVGPAVGIQHGVVEGGVDLIQRFDLVE